MLAEANLLLAELIRDLAQQHELLDTLLIFLADALVFAVPIALIILYLKRSDSREDSLFIFTATVTGIVISYGLGLLYFQEKPFIMFETLITDNSGNSFPSQHAATLFSFAFAALYRKRKNLGLICVMLAILTGFARVAVGYHFPLDILGGLFAGLIGVYLIGSVEEEIENFSRVTEEYEDKLFSTLRRNSSV